MEYNGWANYENWNVVLWLTNTEHLYKALVAYLHRCDKKKQTPTYKAFVKDALLVGQRTGDGISYLSRKLDYQELNEWIKTFASEMQEV